MVCGGYKKKGQKKNSQNKSLFCLHRWSKVGRIVPALFTKLSFLHFQTKKKSISDSQFFFFRNQSPKITLKKHQ